MSSLSDPGPTFRTAGSEILPKVMRSTSFGRVPPVGSPRSACGPPREAREELHRTGTGTRTGYSNGGSVRTQGGKGGSGALVSVERGQIIQLRYG